MSRSSVDNKRDPSARIRMGHDGTASEGYEETLAYDLKFHGLSFQLNSADLEVNSNGTDVALGVGIVCETQQQTRLRRSCQNWGLKIEWTKGTLPTPESPMRSNLKR